MNCVCSDSARFFISDQHCILYFDRFQADTNSKFSDCSYIIGHLNSSWTYILLLQVSIRLIDDIHIDVLKESTGEVNHVGSA